MRILNIVESILLEATPDEIYNAYYKDIPYDVFTQIAMSDPGTLKSDNQLKKIGKYTKLLLTMFKRNNLKTEDLPKATEYLTYVYKHQLGLDNNKVKTLSDLYDIVKPYYTKNTKDLGDVLKALSSEDYKKVFQDDNWTIFIPLTEKGACYLGVNTEWCTTWGPMSLNPDYKDRTNHFGHHNQRGPLYIIINNSNLNEKYQFHFETKQYMDVNDKRIDTAKFLGNNKDVRNFFFPSFVNPNLGEEEISRQIDRMSVLSDADSTDLIEIVLEKVSETNELISAIVNRNEGKINELIQDESLRNDVEIVREKITFTFDKLGNELESVESVISYYESDKYYSGDRIYDDVSNEDDDYTKERLEKFFTQYYEENKDTLKVSYGIVNYEQFKNEFFPDFSESGKINEEIYDKFVSLNYASYEQKCQEAIDDIEKYISFSTTGYRGEKEVELPIGYFLLFLAKKNISSINNNLEEILEEYVSFHNVQTEYEGIYDYGWTEVKYDDVKNEIESYFENIFDNYEGVQECTKLRLMLSDFIEKLFKGSYRFENEHVLVQIDNNGKVDCEDGTVDIIYLNKDTNKQFQGAVKIENLPTYVTNYSLFESVVSFKRFI